MVVQRGECVGLLPDQVPPAHDAAQSHARGQARVAAPNDTENRMHQIVTLR